MPSVHEILTEQFREWEVRGRGWQVFDAPVRPEPPFRPFHGHYLPDSPVVDDGKRPTVLSSFVRHLSRTLSTQPSPEPPVIEPEEEPEPTPLVRNALIELQTFLPADLRIRREEFEQFLSSLSLCREPIAFELLGSTPHVAAQFVVHPQDAALVYRQLQAYFPDVVFTPRESSMETTWLEIDDAETAVIEFGLSNEFMIPLGTTGVDPFVGIVGALSELLPQELALYQVIFEPVKNPWAESTLRAVTDHDGKPFFVNAPELAKEAEKKISRPLYAAIVRIAARSSEIERVWEIVREAASAMGVFARPSGNELIPLANDAYPYEDHVEDLIRRQSRRSGMILNSDELVGFVHLPSVEVRSPKLVRQTGKTKPAPQAVLNSKGLVLGQNVHAGKTVTVALTPEQRVRHTHIIGVSGTGKSTLLFNMIRQGIEHGEGLAVLDPHGDLIDRILGIIPQNRIDDVVLVDPSDEEYAVGFNILSAHSDLEKNLLASDLVSVFQRLSTSWGDQMGSVLQNSILAFLESSRGGTLADLRRFLLEPPFRATFLETVHDSDVVYYWRKVFPQLSGNKSIGPVLTRLDTFLGKKPIRHMVSQKENRLDFADITDTSKIFLARLSEGLLGRENSCLLGALLVSKFQQLAMSRQAKQIAARRDYWIYIDEFANFITPSMAEILSGARKYRIGLTLAHHELHQLKADPKVESAVLTHPFTRVVFRVGDDDARKLAEGFSSFEARDLKNLETGEAIVRVERSDYDFNLTVPLPDEPTTHEATERRQAVITASRQKYATPRAEVEALAYKDLEIEETQSTPRPPPPKVPPSVSPQVETPVLPQSQAPAPSMAEIKTPRPEPKELGRGGRQHKYLQHLIKQLAIGLNFEAEEEKQILGGEGFVDVPLRRGDKSYAFQISVTTDAKSELPNARKCLKAGFNEVVMVSVEPVSLAKLRETAAKEFTEEECSHIRFCLPDEISQLLVEFSAASANKETIVHGRKTKVLYEPMTEEEARRRREILADVSTKSLKKLKGD